MRETKTFTIHWTLTGHHAYFMVEAPDLTSACTALKRHLPAEAEITSADEGCVVLVTTQGERGADGV